MERRRVREQLRPSRRRGGPSLTDRVRRITADDWQVLRELRLQALVDAPRSFGARIREERAWSNEQWVEWAAAASEGHEQSMFLAEPDGRVVGLAGGHVRTEEPGTTGLYAMWVDPSARGSGVSVELVQAVIDWSAQGGARRVSLWVTIGNKAAERLYARLGFVDTGERDRMRWDASIPVMRMARDL